LEERDPVAIAKHLKYLELVGTIAIAAAAMFGGLLYWIPPTPRAALKQLESRVSRAEDSVANVERRIAVLESRPDSKQAESRMTGVENGVGRLEQRVAMLEAGSPPSPPPDRAAGQWFGWIAPIVAMGAILGLLGFGGFWLLGTTRPQQRKLGAAMVISAGGLAITGSLIGKVELASIFKLEKGSVESLVKYEARGSAGTGPTSPAGPAGTALRYIDSITGFCTAAASLPSGECNNPTKIQTDILVRGITAKLQPHQWQDGTLLIIGSADRVPLSNTVQWQFGSKRRIG